MTMTSTTSAEAVLEFVFRPSTTARQIAHNALAVAHSDIVAAVKQLSTGTVDEAIQIIAEAREQLEFAQNAISGRLWTLQ